MKRMINLLLQFSIILLILLISVNIISSGEIEENINLGTSFSISNITKNITNLRDYQKLGIKQNTERVREQVIHVSATKEEKDLLENLEITNPKIPYILGFVSESFTPNEKIDKRIYSKIKELSSLQITNITPTYIKNNYTYGFIMILGKRRKSKLNILEDRGVKLLGYHSGHSYKAKIPLQNISNLEQLSFIKWIGYSTNKQKFDNRLNTKLNNKLDMNEEFEIFINLFDNDTSEEFKTILEKEEVKLIKYFPSLRSYHAKANLSAIKRISRYDFVLSIEISGVEEVYLDQSTPSVSADYIRGGIYDGYGIEVGIIDTGYEYDHQDLPSYDLCGDWSGGSPDCSADPLGHGTFVACTFLGRGNADSKYKGVATGVDDITVARIAQDDGTVYRSDHIEAINWMGGISPAIDVVTDSVGSYCHNTCNGTDALSRAIDDTIFDDYVIFVTAAGNDGVVAGNLSSPGCAKNAITVGNIYDYGDGQIDDINPIKSSRGPTSDGRQKPDLVAPGTFITSCDYQDYDDYYTASGTSYATPQVAGVITTLLDHYPSWRGISTSSSRLKAVLLSSALNKAGSKNNIGNTYGFGKIDSYHTHYNWDTSVGWYGGGADGSLSSDGNWQYFDINVPSGTDRLTVVLVWHEPAASAQSSSAVINDIDLYVDKGADQGGGNTGEYSSTSNVDNVEYVSVDNPGSDTYRIKVYAYDIDPSASPQEWEVGYMIVRGDPTPSTTLTETASSTSVYINEEFTITAKVEPSQYIASGVFTKITYPAGVTIISMNTTREDGVAMGYDGSEQSIESIDRINLGNIHIGDYREVTWTLKATTTGTKNIGTYINSDNAGSTSTSIDVEVTKFEDGHSCTSDSQCQSNYCDNDGVGWSDDYWCFSIESTYYDNQDHKCEESARTANDDWCDEKRNEDLNTCNKVGVAYKEDTCSDICVISDKVIFECDESGCSCTEPLCDGLTTGSNITTCSAGQTYFADKCSSTAGGEDRGDNICRSSVFAAGCTADSECNGVVTGTNDCSSTCNYVPDDPPNVTLEYPPNNNISYTENIIFNCSAADDYNLVNITLYGNWTGTWHANETKTLSGTSDSATFAKTLDNGLYEWNCLAYDTASQSDWGDNNYSLNVSKPEDTQAPNITLINPTDNQNTLGDVIFNISVTDNTGLSNCTLYTNITGSWVANDTKVLTGTSNSTIWNWYNIAKGTYEWNALCSDNNGNSAWNTNNFTFTVYEIGENKFYVKNSTNNAAFFDDNGNLILKGSCTSGGTCTASDDSFIIRNNVGEEVAHLDQSGNLCLETGDCYDESTSCNPTNDAFMVKNETGTIVSYIDITGDLCLIGGLVENGNL